MTDIVEFLYARIGEDQENWSRTCTGPSAEEWAELGDLNEAYIVQAGEHGLRLVEFQRFVLHTHSAVLTLERRHECWMDGDPFPCEELKRLAAIYRDHPEWSDAWKPDSED